jgi:hypothetical protein
MQTKLIKSIVRDQGGIRPLAKKLTEIGKKTSHSNIQYWVSTGRISPDWVPYLVVLTGYTRDELDPCVISGEPVPLVPPVMSIKMAKVLIEKLGTFDFSSMSLRIASILIGHSLEKDWGRHLPVKEIAGRMGGAVSESAVSYIRKQLQILLQANVITMNKNKGSRNKLYLINTNTDSWKQAS